ncbi:MAG TPA: histidinol-phosphatase [Gemmatimonadaceae bacterium]|jgi:histidinol-phosphatase|nr:histidinol-phosphatase [Gemmatimonadota bacterium]MBK7831471.1 histidinol-phosphatase [Gemmatimonadota bacterium]MBK9410382.1 histidinol-phosphatase [Gemmatimonadota bacterium]HNV74764.1 histidinol-phosphatase [Gemmatimonadaceae bacterium]HPV77064.1 histidinol-phosphatase [Gemmatimonadaceae bacterium]
MTTPTVLLEAVTDVARIAGAVALRYFKSSLAVDTKGDGSPVTIADRSAEEAAREWIAARFPGDAVLGEEFGFSGDTRKRRWFIDPIDGTKTFVRGVPLWGTMIAVAQDDLVIAGAIYCPAVEEMVAAAVGCGCWYNGARCAVSQVSTLDEATILVTDARFPYNPHRAERWKALGAQVAVARTWGDCYGYVQVATGRAELMVDDRLSPWDAASLIPIIREAGGVYTDWRGGHEVDGGDGVASNAVLSRPLRDALGVPEP